MEHFQDTIKEIMEMNGLSQEKLAQILGVNQTTVSKWLLGKIKPGYDNILAIYEKFGIEPNELFGIK